MITEETYNRVKLQPVKLILLQVIHRLPDLSGPFDDPSNIKYVTSTIDLHEYRYFWFDTVHMTRKQSDSYVTFTPKIVNTSGKYFINAYIEEYADVLVHDKHLAKQMTNLGWTHVVKNVGGQQDWVEHFDIDHDKLIEI